MVTHFKGGATAELGDYWLMKQRDIEDALAFTRPPKGTVGEKMVSRLSRVRGQRTRGNAVALKCHVAGVVIAPPGQLRNARRV